MRLYLILCAAAMIAAACDRSAANPQPVVSVGVVDSILPVSEEIRRFKTAHAIGEANHALKTGAASREELVQRLIVAMEQGDTTELRGLLIDAEEFINVYYPQSIYTRPPYRQNPAFLWFQIQQNSAKGLTRALQRFGGKDAGYRGFACASEPVQLGSARTWENCTVDWALEPKKLQLFGSIIEQAGHFKFVSYANDL